MSAPAAVQAVPAVRAAPCCQDASSVSSGKDYTLGTIDNAAADAASVVSTDCESVPVTIHVPSCTSSTTAQTFNVEPLALNRYKLHQLQDRQQQMQQRLYTHHHRRSSSLMSDLSAGINDISAYITTNNNNTMIVFSKFILSTDAAAATANIVNSGKSNNVYDWDGGYRVADIADDDDASDTNVSLDDFGGMNFCMLSEAAIGDDFEW
jgi:ethanolamine utilization microcompartment shell protein EutL